MIPSGGGSRPTDRESGPAKGRRSPLTASRAGRWLIGATIRKGRKTSLSVPAKRNLALAATKDAELAEQAAPLAPSLAPAPQTLDGALRGQLRSPALGARAEATTLLTCCTAGGSHLACGAARIGSTTRFRVMSLSTIPDLVRSPVVPKSRAGECSLVCHYQVRSLPRDFKRERRERGNEDKKHFSCSEI